MPFPKLENIEPKYKKIYVATVIFFIIAAVGFVVGSVTMIVRGSQNPPVEMVSGGFGSFPILRLCRSPHDKSSARIVAAKIAGLDNVVNLTTGKLHHLNGVNITLDGRCAVADLRGFGPSHRFPGVFHNSALFFGIKLTKGPPGQALLYYQNDADSDPKALAWLKYDRAQDFVLRKMIRGWKLGYKTILEYAYSFRSLGETGPNGFQPGIYQVLVPDANQGPCWPRGREREVSCANVVIKIFDPMVVKQLKVGICPQLLSVLSSAGSFVSLATVIIGVLFVKKYTRGDFAVAYDTYTLLGMQHAQPVEMRDVPEVKELLLSDYSESSPRESLVGQGLGAQNGSYGEQLRGQGRLAGQQPPEEDEESQEDGGYLGTMYDLVFGVEQEPEPPPPPPRGRPGSRRA